MLHLRIDNFMETITIYQLFYKQHIILLMDALNPFRKEIHSVNAELNT